MSDQIGSGRVALLLAAVTLLAFARALGADFITVDDPLYVTQNPHVQAGLTAEGAVWALRNLEAANLQPLPRGWRGGSTSERS